MLEELALEYKTIVLDLGKNEQKGAEHTKHNPNGRIPTLVDHKNGDFVVWCAVSTRPALLAVLPLTQTRPSTRAYHRESDAVITYLVDMYDTQHTISSADYTDKIKQLQWLFFQASGQG